jgi:hypothetical protein
VTPLLIRWGGDAKENHFQFVEEKQREARPDLFTVPRLYVKTTLETMDGIIAAQPAQGPRGTTNAPRVDNSLPPPATPGL